MTANPSQQMAVGAALPVIGDLGNPKKPLPKFIHSLREQGKAVWQSASWPNKKTEDWKYTNLSELQRSDLFSQQSLEPRSLDAGSLSVADFSIPNLSSYKIVFVDGEYSAELSDLESLPEGLSFIDFQSMDELQQEKVGELINTGFDMQGHIFSALNAQTITNGVFLHLEKNTEIDKPLEIVHLTLNNSKPFLSPSRCLVLAEENASAQLIERFQSEALSDYALVNSITEVFLGPCARLKYYRLNLESESLSHIGGVYASLDESAQLDSFFLAKGGKIKRTDFEVNFNGARAHCSANGVYLPKGKQHVDFHTCMEHRVPNCTSTEVFRGIVSDSAKAVFNGRIHIHPDAQKTVANLSNKNLLTSNKAEVDTKPELEIYADDVQCSHGATVSQLNDTALHYFLTRGIPASEARIMLSFGFINELINQLDLEPLIEFLRPVLAEHFTKEESLTRHLA